MLSLGADSIQRGGQRGTQKETNLQIRGGDKIRRGLCSRSVQGLCPVVEPFPAAHLLDGLIWLWRRGCSLNRLKTSLGTQPFPAQGFRAAPLFCSLQLVWLPKTPVLAPVLGGEPSRSFLLLTTHVGQIPTWLLYGLLPTVVSSSELTRLSSDLRIHLLSPGKSFWGPSLISGSSG